MSATIEKPGHRAGWCIHYRAPKIGTFGHGHEDCEAGVPFANFSGVKFDQRPCFLDKETGESNPGAVPCEHPNGRVKDGVAAGRMRRVRLGWEAQGWQLGLVPTMRQASGVPAYFTRVTQTTATPAEIMPMRRAAAALRSMPRPLIQGPRSLMRTVTDLPRYVTRSLAPKGSVR